MEWSGWNREWISLRRTGETNLSCRLCGANSDIANCAHNPMCHSQFRGDRTVGGGGGGLVLGLVREKSFDWCGLWGKLRKFQREICFCFCSHTRTPQFQFGSIGQVGG